MVILANDSTINQRVAFLGNRSFPIVLKADLPSILVKPSLLAFFGDLGKKLKLWIGARDKSIFAMQYGWVLGVTETSFAASS